MKSAGERSDRNNDPIKKAINAMIRTVDNGYVVGMRVVIVGLVLSVSVSVPDNPPGSFGIL
jgi:hypothetical protein